MSDYCENSECEFYGKKLVNLGWGVPVCLSELPARYPVPMRPEHKGFEQMYQVIKCNEAKPKRE